MIHENLSRARSLLDIGRWEQARDILIPVLAAHPDSRETLCLLARSHQLAGDWHGMLRHAEAAAAVSPEHEWAHRQRSVALRHLYRVAESVEAARTAVRCAPRTWVTHQELAESLLVFRTSDARREAFHAAQHARQLAPHEPSVHVTMGRVYEAIADGRRSREAKKAALALDPEHLIARHNLAISDLHRGHIASAGHQLGSVVADSPQDQLFQRNIWITANAWIWRRAELSTLAWGLSVAISLRWEGMIVARIGSGLIVGCFLAEASFAYLRLSAPMRRLVRSVRGESRRLPLACAALPLVALIMRILTVDPITGAIAMLSAVAAFGCVLVTVPRLHSLLFRPIRRFFLRWWYRLFVLRSGGSYPFQIE
jgi:Flp pilus assembly protein TadD